MNWILASGSPRRRELLEMLGVPDLMIRPATGPERATPGAGPEQTVRELSLHKAQEVAQTCAPEDIIIAADTIVYLDGAILGKPKDHDDAVRMLTALSGREHIVYTGVAVLRGGELRQAAERTAVRFRTLTPAEIERYIATGEPMDKAGAYGIQGKCAIFVDKIDGDYNNVVGLPVAAIYRELKKLGIDIYLW